MGEWDAHHLGAVCGGGREVVGHLGLLQAEGGSIEVEGEKAEFVHVDEATFGDGSPGAEASQVDQRGERGPHETAVVGVGEVADGDSTGRWGHADVVWMGQAAADHQLADLVHVPGRVVALVPPLFRDVRRGEPIHCQGVDAQATVILHGPRAEIPGQLQDAVQGGAVLPLLAEERVGRIPVGDSGCTVGLQTREDYRAEGQRQERGTDVGAVGEGLWGEGPGELQGRHQHRPRGTGLGAGEGGGEGYRAVCLEEVGERLGLVDAHHDGVEG